MTEEKKLEPELRFPGFHEPWEEKKLGKIAETINYGMNCAATEYDEKNKYLRITDIDENTNEYIFDNLVSPAGKLDDKYLLEQGDILFARTGSSVGKTYYYKPEDGKVYFAGFLIRVRIDSKNDVKFIFYTTLIEKYKRWVKVMSARSGQPGINSKEYSKLPIVIPPLPEQEKIGKFFYAIDKKLNLQRERIEELKSYKKGMMQRIFDQEIRFKDEDGRDYPDWEEKKLGKYIVNINNRLGENKNLPVLSSTLSGIYLQNKYFKNNVSSRDLSNYKIIKRDQFTYRSMSDTGDFKFNIQHVVDKGIVSPAYPVFDVKIEVNKSWLYYYMNNSNYIDRQLLKLYQGGTRFALPFSKLIKLYIELPSLPEQEKIANFLSAIDRRIELEEEKLELYEDFKKGLMQRMFV